MLTYRLVAEPSRHRVAVWRELRRSGAVSLQQGLWAVPDGTTFDQTSPATAAAARMAALPVSVRRNCRNGVCRLRAHAVRPANGNGSG